MERITIQQDVIQLHNRSYKNVRSFVTYTFQTKSWQNRWVRSNDKNSSSESGIHFGHYIAGAQYSIISRYNALKTSIALKRGFAPDRWSRSISDILEKKPGVTLTEKLQAILLMEDELNASYKEIFGNHRRGE